MTSCPFSGGKFVKSNTTSPALEVLSTVVLGSQWRNLLDNSGEQSVEGAALCHGVFGSNVCTGDSCEQKDAYRDLAKQVGLQRTCRLGPQWLVVLAAEDMSSLPPRTCRPAQRFQTTNSPNRTVLTSHKFRYELLFCLLMLQQKQNLFLNTHREYFKITYKVKKVNHLWIKRCY